MSSRTTIDPLSITDGKISNQAKINPKKVAPADEASFLITQNDRKYQPKKIHGDGTIDADGRLTISATTSTVITSSEEETLPVDSVKIGPSNYDATENRTKKVGVGPSAIPVRDTSGNLKAETADLATNATTADSATTATTATTATNADNADLLDSQEGTHYLDVTNHNYGSAGDLDTSGGGIAGTSTPRIHKIVAANNSSGTSPTSYVVEHDLGYEPQVTILGGFDDMCGGYDYYEIDAQVKAETDKVTVDISVGSLPLKIICS